MAKSTRSDALATRDSILDAAERLFARQGVSRTTLQHIATEAHVTRGAIYWHFEDKAALFNAMMERATMPLERERPSAEELAGTEPLTVLRSWVMNVFMLTANDPSASRVFEIATLKIEYTDEFQCVRDRRFANYTEWLKCTEKLLGNAAGRGLVTISLTAGEIAQGLWAIVDGLIRIWLLNPGTFDLIGTGQRIIDTFLDGIRSGTALSEPSRRAASA